MEFNSVPCDQWRIKDFAPKKPGVWTVPGFRLMVSLMKWGKMPGPDSVNDLAKIVGWKWDKVNKELEKMGLCIVDGRVLLEKGAVWDVKNQGKRKGNNRGKTGGTRVEDGENSGRTEDAQIQLLPGIEVEDGENSGRAEVEDGENSGRTQVEPYIGIEIVNINSKYKKKTLVDFLDPDFDFSKCKWLIARGRDQVAPSVIEACHQLVGVLTPIWDQSDGDPKTLLEDAFEDLFWKSYPGYEKDRKRERGSKAAALKLWVKKDHRKLFVCLLAYQYGIEHGHFQKMGTTFLSTRGDHIGSLGDDWLEHMAASSRVLEKARQLSGRVDLDRVQWRLDDGGLVASIPTDLAEAWMASGLSAKLNPREEWQ